MRFIRVIGFMFFIGLGSICVPASPVPGSGHDHQMTVKQIRDSIHLIDSVVSSIKSSNNELAIRQARRALVLAKILQSPEELATAYIFCGIAYIQKAKDSSYLYYNLAIKLSNEKHLWTTKLRAMYNLAQLYQFASDYKTEINYLDSVITLAESLKDYSSMASAYNVLGTVNFDIHDDSNSRRNFETALSVARSHSLFTQIGVAIANLAKFEVDDQKIIQRYKEALKYFKKEKGNEEEIAGTLVNLGFIAAIPDTALYYYKAAIEFAKAGNLVEVEIWAFNNMAYSYLDKSDLTNAEICVRDNAIPLALKQNNKDWLSSLYDTYADIMEARGSYKGALDMKKKALSERLAADTMKALGQVRLLAAQLDVKNKEVKIQRSERELLIQRNKMQNLEFWLAVAVLFVIGIILGSLWLRQRVRVKMHREQIDSAKRIIEMEESEKGRTARELHDITGQLVMGIMGEIEGLEFPDQKSKEEINEKIKTLGQSIRRISHKMNRAMIEHFSFNELITGLCEDIGKLSDMKVDLSIPDEFPALPNETVLHFYRIVQELLTNASKYARNNRITLNISIEGNRLRLFYNDNGAGFHYSPKEKTSMGILNIFERAKLIGGEARLITAPGKGTTWEITFPFEKKMVTIN